MSDAQVRNAVGFLSHPKVKPSPTQDKVSFLVKKGLSKEQIAQAFQTWDPNSQETKDVIAGKYDQAAVPSVQIAPAPMPMSMPMQSARQQSTSAWKIAAGVIALIGLGGASAVAVQVREVEGGFWILRFMGRSMCWEGKGEMSK